MATSIKASKSVPLSQRCHLLTQVHHAAVLTSFSICPWPVFEEPEDPSNRSFFSEIISSISDVKFSHNGRYMMTRDYLSVKIWDLNMETRPVETYQVGGGGLLA